MPVTSISTGSFASASVCPAWLCDQLRAPVQAKAKKSREVRMVQNSSALLLSVKFRFDISLRFARYFQSRKPNAVCARRNAMPTRAKVSLNCRSTATPCADASAGSHQGWNQNRPRQRTVINQRATSRAFAIASGISLNECGYFTICRKAWCTRLSSESSG